MNLTLQRSVRVGIREYVWAYAIDGPRIRWFYMPTGVWQTDGPFEKWEVTP
jgi:hypothetical protein